MGIEQHDFVRSVNRLAESVYSLHARFGLPSVDNADTDASMEVLRKRLALISEELGEHARELNRSNLQSAANEAIDIAYIALGTVLTLGRAGTDACYSIAAKNDNKTLSSHRSPGSTGKIIAR